MERTATHVQTYMYNGQRKGRGREAEREKGREAERERGREGERERERESEAERERGRESEAEREGGREKGREGEREREDVKARLDTISVILLFSSRSKTLMTPDLEPAPIQFSVLLKITL